MKVLCTGPESSGTRLLTRIVSSGAYAMHRSLPHAGEWWVGCWTDYDAVVAIVRDEEATIASAVAALHASSPERARRNRDRALRELATLDPIWVQYEDLVRQPAKTVKRLSTCLGVRLTHSEEIRDENAKWGTG